MSKEAILNSTEISNHTNEGREIDFYEAIVKHLREETRKLSDILTTAININNMNLYISTIKSLRETLELIGKYDWKLHYSEYEVFNDSGETVKQISVWEQNHDRQIRNHKFWNVIKG